MKRVRWRLAAAGFVASWALATPPMCWAQGAGHGGEINEVIAASDRWLDFYLALPADWPLSVELRSAAESLLIEATPGLRAKTREWARELHAHLLSDATLTALQREAALSQSMFRRTMNEASLNSLDTAGGAHDAWRVEVEAKPGWCRTFWKAPRWGEVLLQIQRLPDPQRAAALQHEREVLARWGLDRPAVPPRPAFSLDAYAATLVARVRGGRPDQRPPIAMVPVVAAQLLRDNARPLAGSDTEDPPERGVRCAALQWAQANARAERAAVLADLAAAFRYALMFRAEDVPQPIDPLSEHAKANVEIGYPPRAARWELTGAVEVRVVRDAAGRITETSVVARKLTAPGLEGRRPVFLETVLDAASITRARALPARGPGPSNVEFVWKLE